MHCSASCLSVCNDKLLTVADRLRHDQRTLSSHCYTVQRLPHIQTDVSRADGIGSSKTQDRKIKNHSREGHSLHKIKATTTWSTICIIIHNPTRAQPPQQWYITSCNQHLLICRVLFRDTMFLAVKQSRVQPWVGSSWIGSKVCRYT